MVEGISDIESQEAYTNLRANKILKTTNTKITEIHEALEWPLPQLCKNEERNRFHTTFKVCDIARLSTKTISIIGRITTMIPADEGVRLKVEAIYRHDMINIYIKKSQLDNEILFQPGFVALFDKLDLHVFF